MDRICASEHCSNLAPKGRKRCWTCLSRLRAHGDVTVVLKRGPKPGSPAPATAFKPGNIYGRHPMPIGAAHHSWKGDDVAYLAAHIRIRSERGPASTHSCIECGGPAEQWAYQHTDPNERFEPYRGFYSPDPRHYAPMCIRDHAALDKNRRRTR